MVWWRVNVTLGLQTTCVLALVWLPVASLASLASLAHRVVAKALS